MPDQKELLIEAFADQGDVEWGYAGTDTWENGTIKSGSRLAQIEYRDPADATAPNSRYFTDASEVEKLTNADGRVDMKALSESLQVRAHEGQYNPSVSIYEVSEDIPVATSRITDNPAFGRGGAIQYFVTEDMKKFGGSLEKIDQIEGFNRTPTLPVFDDLKGLDPEINANEFQTVIKSYNDAFIDSLRRTDDLKAFDVAEDMRERQAFSETAREIKNDPKAMKAAELPSATATSLDLESKTLTQVERLRDEIVEKNVTTSIRPISIDGANPNSTSSEAVIEPTGSSKIDLKDAITMLVEDQKKIMVAAKQGQSSAVKSAITHPESAQMFQNLHSHGVTTLTVDITPDMSAEKRAAALLLAGRKATVDAGIPMPKTQRKTESTQKLKRSSEKDFSYSF